MKLGLVLLLFVLPVLGQDLSSPVPNHHPITNEQRLKWFVVTTVGPGSLFMTGPLSAALDTSFNSPKEYGPHWDGFGKRYGMRLTGVSAGNVIEAGLGAAWGEDPRYFRSPNRVFGARVKYVIKTSFLAPRPDGRWRPAYARYLGNVGNNFLSNTWRVPSASNASSAASSQYSWCSPPRISCALIRQSAGNSCRWMLGRGRGLLPESGTPSSHVVVPDCSGQPTPSRSSEDASRSTGSRNPGIHGGSFPSAVHSKQAFGACPGFRRIFSPNAPKSSSTSAEKIGLNALAGCNN